MKELIQESFEPSYFFSTGIWFLLAGMLLGIIVGTTIIILIERQK